MNEYGIACTNNPGYHRYSWRFSSLVFKKSGATNHQSARKEYRSLQRFGEIERRQNRLFRRPVVSQGRNNKEVIERW